ncbi:MAG: hypothetical protein QXI19_04900 [Candidatus Caldarchaeum sp.]
MEVLDRPYTKRYKPIGACIIAATLLWFMIIDSPSAAYSEEIKWLNSKLLAKAICDQFMKKLVDGDTGGAMELMRPYFPFGRDRFDKLKFQATAYKTIIQSQLGSAVGYQFLREESIGDVMVSYTFIEKYELSGIAWIFFFYSPDGQRWYGNGIHFTDELARYLFTYSAIR